MAIFFHGLTSRLSQLKHHLAEWHRRTRSRRISRYEAERESERLGIL
jgi:hypothetical protein